MGTIEKGKQADLVLLDANPLNAIDNVRKISAVVVNGRLLDRKALDGLARPGPIHEQDRALRRHRQMKN